MTIDYRLDENRTTTNEHAWANATPRGNMIPIRVGRIGDTLTKTTVSQITEGETVHSHAHSVLI